MSRRNTFAGEEGWGSRKQQPDEMDLDITPMIDVTFLLLIFFMVASTMQPGPNLKEPAAKHGDGVDSRFAITFFVSATGRPGDVPVITDENKVPYTLEQLEARLKEAMKAGKQKFIVRADGRTPAGFLDKVLLAVRDIPDVEIRVGVRERR